MAQTPQPPKTNQKRTDKKIKKKALQEFLKTQASPASDIVSTEYQEKVDAGQQNNCYLCMVQLVGEKRRSCGFCGITACSEHMRKKRKNKELNKFVRICDDCQDKYIYTHYMKLQLKNQQSLSVQQSIVEAQKEQVLSKVNEKKEKFQVHQKKKEEMLSKKKQNQNKMLQQEKQLEKNRQKLMKKQQQLEEQDKKLKQFQQKLPPSLQKDYQSLELQLEKVKKQLIRYDKLCYQAAKSKNKRQKQIYDEYYKWEQAQRQKLQSKKEQECKMF